MQDFRYGIREVLLRREALKDKEKRKKLPRIIDFGFTDPIQAFYWAWEANPELTVTGSWLTEDERWWQNVFEMAAVVAEEERDILDEQESDNLLDSLLSEDDEELT